MCRPQHATRHGVESALKWRAVLELTSGSVAASPAALSSRVPSELLKNAAPNDTFRRIETKHPSRDFANRIEWFDNWAIKPEVVGPLVLPRVKQRD